MISLHDVSTATPGPGSEISVKRAFRSSDVLRGRRNPHRPSRRQRLFRAATWVSIGLALVFAALFATERRAARPPELREPMTFHIPAPPLTTFAAGRRSLPTDVTSHSPLRVRTAESASGCIRWIRGSASAAGTEDAFSPLFWSPDSRFVGFATGMTLKKVPLPAALR